MHCKAPTNWMFLLAASRGAQLVDPLGQALRGRHWRKGENVVITKEFVDI